METLKLVSFIAMVFLELLAIIVIAIKNKNLQGKNALLLGLLLTAISSVAFLLSYYYIKANPLWDGLISFSFICVMLATYGVYEYQVQKYNKEVYNESKKFMIHLAITSIVAIILNIIAVMPKGNPCWVSVGIFFIEN